MRILIVSYVFLPRLGGIEVMTDCLARGFTEAGHEVLVATPQPGEAPEPLPYPVLRNPSAPALWRAARRSDTILQQGASLRLLLPLLLSCRPLALVHHTWLPEEGAGSLSGRMRRWALRRVRNFAVSGAVADHLPVPAWLLANCYRSGVFRDSGSSSRRNDLCCAARMVSDKGVDLLIGALARLAEEGLRPRLLLVGDGPERAALERQAAEAGLDQQVRFAGNLDAPALAAELNDSRILVVPSRYREPFGIIALEGAACGCFVVGADGGGLEEAIGPCGITFTRGSSASLAAALKEALERTATPGEREAVAAHLARYSEPAAVARYLDVLRDLTGDPR